MSKKIIALIVAIIMTLLCFVSCNKKAKDDGLYYVDEEGNTQAVHVDKDGNYYIEDEKGNVSYIEDDNVIEQIEQNSEAASLEEILSEIETDPDKIFDDADKEDKFEISDELVEETIVTVAPDKGEKEAQERLNKYMSVLGTNVFTIDATIKEIGTDNMEYPFTYIRNGNSAYIQTAVPFEEGKVIKANMIIVNGKTYCEIPSLKSYMVVDDMTIEDLADGTFDKSSLASHVFVESGTVTLNGKKYTCDVYEVGSDIVKYYYSSNKLVRIEKIGKRESVITEIESIKNTADKSKIKKPKGFDITSLIE